MIDSDEWYMMDVDRYKDTDVQMVQVIDVEYVDE